MVKNLPTNAEDVDSILGSGRSPGEGNGNSLQYSCLGNHMDIGAWWTSVHVVLKELDTRDLNNNKTTTDGSRAFVQHIKVGDGLGLFHA